MKIYSSPQRPVAGVVSVVSVRGSAVVRGEDYDSVIEHAAMIQCTGDVADRIIKYRQHCCDDKLTQTIVIVFAVVVTCCHHCCCLVVIVVIVSVLVFPLSLPLVMFTTIANWAFLVVDPQTWNDLPDNVTCVESLST